MNPAQLSRFSQQAARQRAKLFSIRVIFRGAEIAIPKPTVDPSYALDTGGYRPEAVYRFRVPDTVTPPPAAKEIIQEIATGQHYTVLTCVPANSDCPTAAEHLVEAKRS